MKILFRYVLKEFCIPLGYCLMGFISIYVLFELFSSFSRLSEAKPAWEDILNFFAGYLAPYFEWMAPACLMLAVLYTMWSFCRHSEITAMRASGIGFFTIVKPLLLVAVLMAAAVCWVNECFVPEKAQWAVQFRTARFKLEKMERQNNTVFHSSQDDRTWNIGMMVTPDARIFESVTVCENHPNGARKMTVKSPRVEYLDGQWWFLNATVSHYDMNGVETVSPVPELDKLKLRSFPEFVETPRDFLLQNRDWAYCSVSDRMCFMRAHPNLSAETKRGYEYDTFSQIVSPLACIVITLFAIPAGIATGRQSVFKGIVTALGMFFAFYALTILFMILAKLGWCAPLAAAIIPDVVFLMIGGYMFWRQR